MGGKSLGYGLPHTGSLGEQQVVTEVQGAGDRQELAHGSEAGLGLVWGWGVESYLLQQKHLPSRKFPAASV